MDSILSPGAIAQAGRRLYEERLRAALEPNENGRYLVLDVETGEFELGDVAVTPTEKMRQRFPNTLFFAMRVGHAAMLQRGGRTQRRAS